MGAYPFGLLFADDLAQAESWAVEHSKLTHRDPIAFAACAAMAVGTAHFLSGTDTDVALEAMREAAGRHDSETAEMIARLGVQSVPEEWIHDFERNHDLIELADRVANEPMGKR